MLNTEINITNRILYTTLIFFIYILLVINTGAIDYVIKLGRYIPRTDIGLSVDYLYGIVWAWILACSINYWPIRNNEKTYLLFLWLVKVFVTLVCMLFYEYIYKLDAYGYFIVPLENSFSLHSFLSMDGTENLHSFVWYHHKFFPDSFHLLKTSFSMLGFIAAYLYYRAFAMIIKDENINILLLFCLFPSILFFSSTIGKEPIILFSISMYILGVIGLYYKSNICYLIMIAVGIALTLLVRYWMGGILIFSLVIFLFHSNIKTMTKMYVSIFMLFLIFMFCIPIIHNIVHGWLNVLAENLAYGGSRHVWYKSFDNVIDVIEFIPFGIFNALFRPLPGEVNSAFGIMSGIENLILLLGTLFAIYNLKKSIIINPVFQWLVLTIVCWLSIYFFVSYFNFGTAVRYKVQILPIILIIIAQVYYERKLKVNNN